MAEIKLSGWQALAAGAALAAFGGMRALSMGDMRGNDALTGRLEMQLVSEYLPNELEKVKGMMAAGSEEAAFDKAGALSKTEVKIKEVKAGMPVYLFSSGKREGVLRVRFTLKDGDGPVKEGINFYRYEHHPLGNTWYIQRPATQAEYYMSYLF